MNLKQTCDYKIDDLQTAIDSASSKIQEAKNAISLIEKARDKTEEFLKACAEVGITKLSVGTMHKSIPSTKNWPFGHSGSVFAFQPKGASKGWPPIWGVCEKFGYSGCGNSDQYQGGEDLIDGVYHLRGGKWSKVA